jgi:integrase
MTEQTPQDQVPAQPPAAPKSRAGKRAHRLPLTLHSTGQYCKKIHGKMYYFGKDKQEALQRYLQQATALHTAPDGPAALSRDLTLRALCELYLRHQLSEATTGQIKQRYYYDLRLHLRAFVKYAGPDTLVTEIKIIVVQKFREKLLKQAKAPRTVNNHLAAVRAMFRWAEANEIIERGPNFIAVKKVKVKKVKRQTFTAEEVRKLLSLAGPTMKAMILLALNCEFGCTDCAELRWEHLNLDAHLVDFPRGKTGVERKFRLWAETVEAVKALPARGDLVFYTHDGNPWVRPIEGGKSHDDALSKEFTKLLKRAEIACKKGTGFYSLRRTASTKAALTGNAFAVQGMLGHADLTEAST